MAALTDQVVVVTGGGRGLGASICRALSREGAKIAVMDVDGKAARREAAALTDKGADALALETDVGSEAQVKAAIAEVVARFGRLDALVNNAGIDKTCSVEELACDEWERILRTNLSGPFMLAKYAAEQMRAQGNGGQIVNIASTAAKRAWANASAYHASKWGLVGLSQALHVELRPEGIKVTTVIAGGMRTPFLLERFPDLDPGLLQDPDNVADTVRYLLTLPAESVIAEIMVLPMRETSWP
ncbi:putative short chain dehydrogenase [Thiobacillus denitrificans ATCC 25259]|uniref:Putative short chain dehydrogenase n=1 Tax=Thiobacillus denitrificans (strain ATCC 25259 / T1) TaxID=292415 RepID=Q3SKT8_THIDA|nr:SDR family NAD(P)-dependent oxidoreductase [Thiobacillus denitrificans]AAZ96687.1 putative short chain dehydrogenase [Thiobacillus denitrificans ATCC 25259]